MLRQIAFSNSCVVPGVQCEANEVLNEIRRENERFRVYFVTIFVMYVTSEVNTACSPCRWDDVGCVDNDCSGVRV